MTPRQADRLGRQLGRIDSFKHDRKAHHASIPTESIDWDSFRTLDTYVGKNFSITFLN